MNFINPDLQKTFDNKGFVVIDLLDSSEIKALQMIYNQYPAQKVADFQVSNYEKDPQKNKAIDFAIKRIISKKISTHINGYRMLSAYFYIKFPGQKSSFYIHKDWNIVDESKNSSMHIWIPLADTNIKNGNLFFCPFEYKLNRPSFRGSPGFEYPKTGFISRFVNNRFQKDVFTKEGQAICFKHKMTHGSRANNTETQRVAAGVSILPVNAQMIHYHMDKNDNIQKFNVSDDFYLDFDLNSYPVSL